MSAAEQTEVEHVDASTAQMLLDENRRQALEIERLTSALLRIRQAADLGRTDCLGDTVAEGSFLLIHGLASRVLVEP